MLDPRIYRTGFIAVALAVIVFAFSLGDQRGALSPTLAPDAFNGPAAHSLMNAFAATYPDRRPGSDGDTALAADIARRLRQVQGGYTVSTHVFKARTVDGTRTLENVIATKVGEAPGTILVVSHRDSLADGTSCGASPGQVCNAADLSGSAGLIELGRVLAGETQHRTIVLASTSGSAGASGAAELARTIPGPIDAVVVLGDLAGNSAHQPIIVPWSDGLPVAPTMLRNTVAGALASQAAPRSTATSVAGQLAHLAFPFTLSEQGPFGARGIPAVTLSLSGDGAPAAGEPTSADQMTAMGRSVLLTINALDNGPQVARADAFVLFQGKVIPAWAIRLLVLALILPVLIATIDGLARARRRGHSIGRAVVWVLASAVPFAFAALLIVGGARHRGARYRSACAGRRRRRAASQHRDRAADRARHRRRPRVLCAATARHLARRRQTGGQGPGRRERLPRRGGGAAARHVPRRACHLGHESVCCSAGDPGSAPVDVARRPRGAAASGGRADAAARWPRGAGAV